MTSAMRSRKNIVAWVSYDFANSILSITFFLYFAQWAVIDQGIADFYFNLTFTITALLLLLTVPLTGAVIGRFVRRISGLRYATAATAFLYAACSLFAIWSMPVASLIFFTLGMYAYLLSFTFYTPLLNDIASSARRGFVSGLGIAANYAGQFAGLLVALPFSNGSIAFFGALPRAETLLPAVIVFSILSLPMMFLFDNTDTVTSGFAWRAEMRRVISETRRLFLRSPAGIFLLSYFLFNDAILTVSNNFPIFLEQVWHLSDTTKTYILLGVLVTCAIGGIVSGLIADRCGHRRTLGWILFGWLFMLPMVGLINNFPLFVISTILMGFWFGATWTVSRSLMGHIASPGTHNFSFAYFGLAERASSLIGPLAWGALVSYFIEWGAGRYRLSVVVMAIFVALSMLAFRRVPDDRSFSRV